jgi:UDP-4-amino-4,6-dideoxy-N-acetyl-beta-L-altrosamine N-acetyltransferase
MIESDLEQVLKWRNHPDIRCYMYTQRIISREEHKTWFDLSIKDDNKHLLIYEENNAQKGFVQFQREKESHFANWGFYTEPNALKGTGRRLGQAALWYAFVDLQLHKVYGESLALNQRSIRFHRALGFRQEGRFRDHHFDGRRYHDVIRFGLVKPEWKSAIKEKLKC